MNESSHDEVDPLTAPVGTQFVVKQHHATALHHDVRLEMMGEGAPMLVSWAVPKGLPRNRGVRHLAIRTPDHSMEEATFPGTVLDDDEYGPARILDRGSYEMVERSDDRITFRLDGERLAGVWHLVHTGEKAGKDQWLAMMSEDLRSPGDDPPLAAPMLASSTAESFDDPDWWFEPKWDGIRAIAVCSEETRLISRKHRDVTVAYPELHRLHDQVVALDAMLDGEVVAFEDGVPSFQRLQQRMHVRDEQRISQLARTIPVAFVVFDLLFIDGDDLTDQPLEERRRLLEESVVPSEQIQVSPVTKGEGLALFESAAGLGLEGIMAKRVSSVYLPGTRSREWLKVKIAFDADVVIVGWTAGEGHREGSFGSLMMAVYDDGELRYVGNVGTGFDNATLADVFERLGQLAETAPPFPRDVLGSRAELRRAHWVTPSLVAKVEHRQVTSAGRLRSPSFLGFHEDKDPEECTFDQLT